MRSVDVCVATFRRPRSLAELLSSLARQHASDFRVRIVVVDNDRECSSRDTIEAFRRSSPWEVVYDVEAVQSIAAARNRALSLVAADFFAFIDDDETASPDWLAMMMAACESFGADAVFGPVVSVLDDDAPRWAKQHSVFRRTRRPSGSVLRHGATGNCVVRTKSLGVPRQTFDPAYGLTGGEDSDFFHRLYLSGRRLVWCDGAEVFERVPSHRATMDWVRRRSYRSGQSFYRVFVRRDPALRRALWCARQAVQLAGAAAVAPLARLVSYTAFSELAAAAYRSAGQLTASFGAAQYEEYDARRHC
jgi:succinoglycan biosynthesis protein ExoM